MLIGLFSCAVSSHITPILRSLHCLKMNERIEYKLLSLIYKVLTTSQPDYLHNLISVQSTGRTWSTIRIFLITNHQLLFHIYITLAVESASFNLILFTVLLVHLILHISPRHSHYLCCHHLSLPRPFTPDL